MGVGRDLRQQHSSYSKKIVGAFMRPNNDLRIDSESLNPSKKALMQFVKFGMVGISNTVISYAVYAVLVFFGCPYLIANLVAFVVSVLNSFLLE